MDRLCVWFLRRFVSPEAVELLVRHFIVETNLLNVIADNSGPGDILRVELLPTRLAELGDGMTLRAAAALARRPWRVSSTTEVEAGQRSSQRAGSGLVGALKLLYLSRCDRVASCARQPRRAP